jgi:deoxyhypusine synthase
MKFREHKVEPLDPAGSRAVDDLVKALGGCGFQGRKLSECANVWEAMCREDDCLKVFTLSGAMVPAGMGEVVMQLIEARAIDVVVSTGANVTHDFVNAVVDQGHYRGSEHEDDDELYQHRINRIFDVYIPEDHYQAAQAFLFEALRKAGVEEARWTTSEFTRFLGQSVSRRSLVQVAARHEVPIFVPAISDSELGLSVTVFRQRGIALAFDELGDIDRFAALHLAHRTSGCVVVGGGVPRNWAQQVFPYLDGLARLQPEMRRFEGYELGVRITTDRPEFGGLSGCTFEESKSWGKYAKEARFASVVCDATIALPLLATALLERLEGSG